MVRTRQSTTGLPAGSRKGSGRRYSKRSLDRPQHPTRWPWTQQPRQNPSMCYWRKRGPAAQAIGDTKGGRNTKIHAVVDDQCRPWVLVLRPGNTSDCVMAEPCVSLIVSSMTGAHNSIASTRRVADDLDALVSGVGLNLKAARNRSTEEGLTVNRFAVDGVRVQMPPRSDRDLVGKGSRARAGPPAVPQ
jgi:hypothetical protein